MAIYTRNDQGGLDSLKIVGLKGENGITPNIQIGAVTTLEAGEQATVKNVGTLENPILDFGIPKGIDGKSGGGVSIDDTTISSDKTWSSMKIEDYVLTNDNTVWLDTNGESLKIDSTKEGYLREIEIFGNTIQNEEDLTDIQHLGELYTDGEGSPILDDLGRKQYKIEIESSDSIRTNLEFGTVTNNGELQNSTSILRPPSFLTLSPNTKYKIVTDKQLTDWYMVLVYFTNEGVKTHYTVLTKTNNTFTSHSVYTKVLFRLETIKPVEYRNTDLKVYFKNVADSNEEVLSHTATILLPCQLMKVGDVADRLYWDSGNRRYVVEKNVGSERLYDIPNVGFSLISGFEESSVQGFRFYPCGKPTNNEKTTNGQAIVKGMKREVSFSINNEEAFNYGKPTPNYVDLRFKIEKSKLNSLDLTGLNEYLNKNDFIIFYNQITELIETNITEQIKLPTYIGTTYITVTGGLQGTIKAKAPVDGSATINVLVQENKELKIANEELKAVNKEQDEIINISLMATDEIFAMLEPLLNVTALGNSSKMANMYKIMIQKGLRKIEEVPERYRIELEKH